MTRAEGDQESPLAGLDATTPVVVIDPLHVGLGIARSLGRLRIEMHGLHSNRRAPAARSRYWTTSTVWQPDNTPHEVLVERLLSLAETFESPPLLIACDDASCLFVADAADELRKGFVFPAQPAGLSRSLSDKREMYLLCNRLGTPTPESVFPASRAEVEEFARDCTMPVMLKGIDTLAVRRRTGASMVIARTPEELLRYYDAMETPDSPSLMIQEYIPGGPESVWMFNGYFDGSSDCLFGFTGQKLRQYPAYTGATSLGICARNDDVAELTVGLMKAVGYRGILDIGWRYDARDGTYNLLDVNPRIGATFRLFVDASGLDVARALYLDLTGQEVPATSYPEGRKWLVENFDCVSSMHYYRDGNLKVRDWLRSFRGVEERAWWASDDRAPFWAMCRQSLAYLVGGRSKRDRGVAGEPALIGNDV
jgi:D-aspartate ligase